MKKDARIPQFDLYGDQNHYKDPDFIHIEEIAERSSSNGWKIKPHRHGKMLQVLCMYSGKLSAAIDSKNYELEGCWAIVIPPGTVHGFSFSSDTEGIVLTVAEPFLSGRNTEQCKSYFEIFKYKPYIIELDNKNVLFSQLVQYSSMIKHELNNLEVGYDLVLNSLMKMFLMALRRQLDLRQFEVKTGEATSIILIKFRHLIEQHFRQHWTVQDYAKALHTSESTLNRLCNEVFGNPAKSIIHNRMVTAIKRRLIFTKQPLDQIAYSLGYKDPSYFSRFFKNQTNLSPSQFRKQKNDIL